LSTEEAIARSGYQADDPRGFDDGGYSALHRPGSWEWQLPHAAAARARLESLGFEAVPDPDASWRVQWWAAMTDDDATRPNVPPGRVLPLVDPRKKADAMAAARAQAHASIRRAEEQAKLNRERWGEPGPAAMTRLARSFPSLRDAFGVEPWDALAFIRWSDGPQLTTGMAHAIRFVLQVWNPSTDWRETAAANGIDGSHLGPFNVVSALASWDYAHCDAFLAWCEAPFLP
jgi:hypothetical protein